MSINIEAAGPLAREIVERDHASLSNSYTRDYPLVTSRALGSEVWDIDGRRYVDFVAGIAVMNVGHRHPAVETAVKEQIDRVWHMCLSDFYQPEAVELAERLQAIAPMSGDTRVFFSNTGTEAVEAAIKLAMYHTGRSKFIGFLGGFHGRTLGSLSFTASKAVQRAGFPQTLDVTHIPYPDLYRPLFISDGPEAYGDAIIDYLENEVMRTALPAQDVAAILVEPIQGEGGYIVPPAGFMKRIRELCDKHGFLLIADEIQSGIGRTGMWWAIEHDGVEPDIVCFAKGVASGMPLGGIIAKSEIMDWKPGSHGTTFGGNSIAIASALATLDVIEREGLLEKASESGQYIQETLRELQTRFECIGDVRGRGMMVGAEIVTDRLSKKRDAAMRDEIVKKAFEEGLLLLPCGANTVRFAGALNMSRELIDEGMHKFEKALEAASRAS